MDRRTRSGTSGKLDRHSRRGSTDDQAVMLLVFVLLEVLAVLLMSRIIRQ